MAKKDIMQVAGIELNKKRYELRFSHKAIMTLESYLDTSVFEFLERFQTSKDKTKTKRMDYKTAAMVVWFSLQHHQVFENMTFEAFISELDKNRKKVKWVDIFNYATDAIKTAFGPVETEEENQDGEKKKTITTA